MRLPVVGVNYAIQCGSCKASVPLAGQMLATLSSEVTDFMAVHDHCGRDFPVLPVVTEVAVSITARIPVPAKPAETATESVDAA